jgi:hypothetical protein
VFAVVVTQKKRSDLGTLAPITPDGCKWALPNALWTDASDASAAHMQIAIGIPSDTRCQGIRLTQDSA